MKLAPIVLFTYNRPIHTQQVLNSLAANMEAKESILYIFSDGAKENADATTLKGIEETRNIIKTENRFKKVIITVQQKNKGLAKSIIDGVTAVVNEHGTVIVLEDDLVLSPYFLFYMNDSLLRYEKDKRVSQIGACNFFACGSNYPDSFFLAMPDCLGWATWKNRWEHFNSDAQYLLDELKKRNLIEKFNAYGSYDMESMLKDQIGGNGSSWAIRWQAVCVLNSWLTLYPNPSFSNHVESKEATHANKNVLPPLCTTEPSFKTIEVKEIPEVIEAMKKGYTLTGDYFGNATKPGIKEKIIKMLSDFIPNSKQKK